MGALTLKNFAFEFRGWDITKFESVDVTDSFLSKVRVYLHNNKVIQIEPEYDSTTKKSWLSDKGRQFFDGFYNKWASFEIKNKKIKKFLIKKIIKNLSVFIYFYDYSSRLSTYKITVIFDNLSIDTLCLLKIIENTYSFFNVKNIQKTTTTSNDLEKDFKTTIRTEHHRWDASEICLLISTNPRYEGYPLNLNIRQRFLKGNFKCLVFGSFIDITFPVTFIGASIDFLKSFAEGTHINCQIIKKAKSPFVIYNSEFLNRKDNSSFDKISYLLNSVKNFSLKWHSISALMNTSDINSAFVFSFGTFSTKDLKNFKCLFFLNTNENTLFEFKKIINLKLLTAQSHKKERKKLFLSQNYKKYNTEKVLNLASKNIKVTDQNSFFHIASTIFFENEETFLSAEGKIINTKRLLFRKKTRSIWQILRKLIKLFKRTNFFFTNKKDGNILFFNSEKFIYYKNFINFHYYATKSLKTYSYLLNQKTSNYYFERCRFFKSPQATIKRTRFSYWLNDFFSSGKDEYSCESLILQECSLNTKDNITNFF